jgi:hypothetical protein
MSQSLPNRNRLIEHYISVVKEDGIVTNKNVNIGINGATPNLWVAGNITVGGTISGGSDMSGAQTITATTAHALAVGQNGTTNPVFNVDTSVSSAATGIDVVGNAAGNGVNISALSSASQEFLRLDAKSTGAIVIGSVSSGQVSIGRASLTPVIGSTTTTSLGTHQNSTPSAAQLVGGIITQTGATGAGTVTLDTGTNLSTAVNGVTVGDTFQCLFANLGGGQTLTITGATGSTVIGTAAVGTGKNAMMTFVNTGTNTWNVYVNVSA